MDFPLIVGVLVLVSLLIVFSVVYLSRKKRVTPSDRKFFQQKWEVLLGYPDLQKALMEADKLLDLALKKKGYEGSLGEKLKKSGRLFQNLDGVWSAHKMRNRIAHEIGLQLTPRDAKSALSHFRQALRDLGFL